MNWGIVQVIFASSKVFVMNKEGVWDEGNIAMLLLKNFSDFFEKKIAIFVT